MNKFKIIVIIIGLCLFLAPLLSAQDSVWINYQGRLTASNGDPVPLGNYNMEFKLYEDSITRVPFWAYPTVVPVDEEGLLLAQFAINGNSPGVGEIDWNRYLPWLGISVEGEEVQPRTKLTSALHAFISKRMNGDIKTNPGIIEIYNPDACDPTEPCEPAIEIVASLDTSKFVIHPPDPCVPPEPCTPAFEASVTDSLTALTLTTRPSDPTEPTIETVIEAGDQEVDFDIVVSVPGDDDITPVSIGTNIAAGSSHMVLLTPSGGARVELKTDESSGSPGIIIKSEVSGYPRSGDERLQIDEDGFLMEASAWDDSNGDSSWTFVRLDTAGAKAEIAQKDGSGESTVVAMQANDSLSKMELTSQIGESSYWTGLGGGIWDTFAGGTVWGDFVGSCLWNSFSDETIWSNSFQGASVWGAIAGSSIWSSSTGDTVRTNLASTASASGLDASFWNQSAGTKAKIEVAAAADSCTINTNYWSSLTRDSSSVNINSNTSAAGITMNVNKSTGEYSAVKTEANPTHADLRLYYGDSSEDPDIALRTTADGGKVGINTNDPTAELYVVGDITATGAITEISSIKYKTRLSPIDNALDKISELRGVTFNWRRDAFPKMNFSEDTQIGVVAEEVETVIPELVHQDDHGEKSVDYSKLTAVLIEAVKELKAENDELWERLERLETRE